MYQNLRARWLIVSWIDKLKVAIWDLKVRIQTIATIMIKGGKK